MEVYENAQYKEHSFTRSEYYFKIVATLIRKKEEYFNIFFGYFSSSLHVFCTFFNWVIFFFPTDLKELLIC